MTTELGHAFLALGLEPAAEISHADDTEVFALARVPFREVLGQVLNGNIWDMITIASVLRVYHMAREGELPGELTRAML